MKLQKTKEILTDLVAFDVLGGQSNLSILAYIKNFLSERGIDFQLVPNPEGTKASLHCRIGPAVDGGVILSGHTDVVPVKGQDWQTAPFELIEKEDKLFARGSCDMKGFLACCLASVELFQKTDLKKPIYFAFSYDEEIGCLAAPELARAIKSHYTENIKYALIGEPTMMVPMVGQKGICVLKTTVKGSAGHSSRIKQEVSAIHVAAKLVVWLENKMDELVAKGETDDRFKPNHTSIHIGKFNGGIAPNVIADTCTFYWDVRTIPKSSLTEIMADFEAYCETLKSTLKERFAGAEIITEIDHPAVPPLDTPEHLSVVALIKKISENNTLDTVSYAAEAGQFAEVGFEAVICGPGDIAQAHRANEFVAISQLEKCLKMLENLAVELS
ncbi:acetylornithine deacetylase [Lacihabitans lacunae]|uniref:Acetylornithine deacetylase n=1 Tax=Lacihabitans lacunae TaxID=1028214 RepID=A0ABV7YVI8_9BACT